VSVVEGGEARSMSPKGGERGSDVVAVIRGEKIEKDPARFGSLGVIAGL